jgi:hypothetical protein
LLPPTSADLARRIRAAAAAVDPPAVSAPGPETAAALPLLPRRRPAPEAESAPERTAPGLQHEDASDSNPPGALPRRTRNRAAVRESTPSVSAALADAELLDAEAARAAVEEFEAGVAEALRATTQNLPIIRASDEPEGIRP